jgi:hypothetical protein
VKLNFVFAATAIGSLEHFTFLGIFVEFVSLPGLRIRIWIGERARTMTKAGLVVFFSRLRFSNPCCTFQSTPRFTFSGAKKL